MQYDILKVLMLISQVHLKNVLFVINVNFQTKDLSFNHVYNGCHEVLMISIDINSIVILNIHIVVYQCIIAGNTKSEATSLCRNVDVAENSRSL